MSRPLVKSLKRGLLAGALAGGVSFPALAVLSPGQIQSVTEAVALPVDDAVLALRTLFAGNVPDVVELAEEATRQAPQLCEQIMSEATRAAPDNAGDLAIAIIALAPQCEEQIAQILTEGPLETAAGPVGAGPPGVPGAPGAPNPSPISSPSTTAENPATDVASPTEL